MKKYRARVRRGSQPAVAGRRVGGWRRDVMRALQWPNHSNLASSTSLCKFQIFI